MRARNDWPELPLRQWQDTYETLHLYAQRVGKVRLALAPRMNQMWQVAMYVTARGLTTSPMAYPDGRTFEVQFDFLDHELLVLTSDGDVRSLPLIPRSVALFSREFGQLLEELDLPVKINELPVEIPDPIPFSQDRRHASYDREPVERFFEILRRVDTVLKEFRAHFAGKSSPVHFFWGSFDLAVTRFSGRWVPVPAHADVVTRESYNQECSSVGFWPGGGDVPGPAFYAYTAPEPYGLAQQPTRPERAFYSDKMKEFLLMYDDARSSEDPAQAILDFAQSTYEAGAVLADWDREELEWPHREGPHPTGALEEGEAPAVPSPA